VQRIARLTEAASNRIKSTRLSAIGRYRLLAAIGQGGMAEVFLASLDGPAQFSKLMAVKVLRSELADDPEGREMFLNEARLAARLAHPNVVQTIEVAEHGHRLHLVMEYLDGQSFSRMLQHSRSDGGKRLPLPLAVRVIVEALAGLDYAHELPGYDGKPLRLVHRDVSPANIFVTYDGEVKVLDFGIAKALDGDAQTRTGVLKGKVGYLAPEQMSDVPIDRRIDIYAAGVMLWEAATGRRLWKGLSDVAALTKVATEGVPSPRTVEASLPEALERIICKATARDRNARYATAAELAGELEAYLESSGEPSTKRALARWIHEAFADVREETRRLIERQVKEARDLPAETLDAVALPATSGATASIVELPQVASPATGSVRQPLPPSRGSRLLLVVTTLVLGAAIALAGAIRYGHGARAPAAAEPTHAAAIAPSSAPVTRATLFVRATPSTARIYLDDQQLVGNPASEQLPLDGQRHVVRVEADGHVGASTEVVLDGDKSLALSLAHAKTTTESPSPGRVHPKKAVASPTAAAVAVTAPTPAPAPPPPTTMKKKTIDEENPFVH